MNGLEDLITARPPTAQRPLLGLTVLMVEDSRFACEAVRLLCLRSGARIRRADSLEHAHRHLSVYSPSVLIVDVGLPDGSGIGLIEAMTSPSRNIEVVLGTSGDPAVEGDVLAAGADGFVAKPIASLAAFQSAILRHLPADRQPPGPRLLTDETVSPDLIAYRDDLNHVARVLQGSDKESDIDYVTQFLGGVARSAQDDDLNQVVIDIATKRTAGAPVDHGITTLSKMVNSRLASGRPV